MGVAAVPLLIGGLVASAGAGIAGTVLGFQNAAFQRSVARRNAEAARQQAAAEEERVRRDRARRIGTLTAQAGAQGGTLTGSFLDIIADESAEAELDALTVRAGGQFRALDFENQASIAGRQQIGAIASGVGNLGSTVLTGTGALRDAGVIG